LQVLVLRLSGRSQHGTLFSISLSVFAIVAVLEAARVWLGGVFAQAIVSPMLDPTLYFAAISGAVVVVLTSLGGTVVLIINAVSASKDRREAAAERLAIRNQAAVIQQTGEETAKKADGLITATAQIHELTNSTNSELQKALELSKAQAASVEKQNVALERLIAELKQKALDVTASQALSDQRVTQALAAPAPEQLTDQTKT
jgi:hypothetical protein